LTAVVEGAGTEYDYLRHLNEEYGSSHQFYITIVADTRSGFSPRRALDKAVEIRTRHTAATWILFDRDDNDPAELLRVLADADRVDRLRIAFSNPCFELWLYLHFRESPGPQHGARARLLELLRNAHPAFQGYGQRDGKRLPAARLHALQPTVTAAASRAARLTSECTDGHCTHNRSGRCGPLHQDPCSGVHLLLRELGIV
jgi:hypothetical protein